ncbi:MAG: hypothetical protein RR904_05290 [Bacilli bacterium]
MVKLFHGGVQNQVINMTSNININLGAGELGKGFYAGLSYGLSKSWAYHKTQKFNIKNNSSENYAILKIEFPKISYKGYVHYLSRIQTIDIVNALRFAKLTKTCSFGVDAICGQIVGNHKYRSMENGYLQVKFEGNYSESFLNSQAFIKVIK